MPSPVFIEDKKKNNVSFDVKTLLGLVPTSGDVGLEVEVEGNKFPKGEEDNYIPQVWGYHHDGSLRGLDNAEYVLRKPLPFKDVPKALEQLWSMFSKYGTVLDDSNRTSVHVHMNVQDFYLNRLCSFFAIYFAVEELLSAWAGSHRMGNLFCMRGKDAPAIITRIKDFIRNDGKTQFSSGMHYSGLNAGALFKFGSIEVRLMSGTDDVNRILQWVEMCRRIYDLSADFKDPRSVCELFSSGGPIAFLETIFGPSVSVLRDGIEYNEQQIMESLYEGIRLSQDLCYCRDWDKYSPHTLKKDPFGRSQKTVINSITQQAAGF